MLVSALQKQTHSGRTSVTATVAWEDVDRPPFHLFAETDEEAGLSLWPDPNALLICCLLPAWDSGEKRIRVEGDLCPILHEKLKTALSILRFWYADLGPLPSIEPTGDFVATYPSSGRALSLLSCGIDSLATLRFNRLWLPSDHPDAIRAVLPLSFVREPTSLRTRSQAEPIGRIRAASAVACDVDVELLPVETNAWWLVGNGYFYDLKWQGAVLSSMASLFSKGFSSGYIASSFNSGYLFMPWGSNPLLDPNYGGSHFRIHHHGTGLSRLEKTSLVADWPTGLNNLRVCQRDDKGARNCGRCEKCIRTMISLLALDKLQECDALPMNDVTSETLELLVDYDMIATGYQIKWYEETIPYLIRAKRTDIADKLSEILERIRNEMGRTLFADRALYGFKTSDSSVSLDK